MDMRHKIAHVVRHVHKHLSRTDVAVVAAAALVLVVSAYSIWLMSSAFSEFGAITANLSLNNTIQIMATPTPAPPPRISAAYIHNADCEMCLPLSPILTEDFCGQCIDLSPIIKQVNSSANLTISDLQYDSAEARALIAAHGIQVIPAIVFTGEVNKSQGIATMLSQARKSGEAYVVEPASPPYYSLSESRIVGIVNATMITVTSCADCFPVASAITQLKSGGVAMGPVRSYEYNSTEGMALAAKYNMTKLPGIVFSGDFAAYKDMLQMSDFDTLFSQESDGSLVMRYFNSPYLEPETGRMRGYVDGIFLNDSSCAPCYNVSMHENAVKAEGVVVANYTTYDVSSPAGKALIAKYNITKVPTLLLSPEAGVYPELMNVWPNVGTVEGDGWLVFRNFDAISGTTYKDLENNTIIVRGQAG